MAVETAAPTARTALWARMLSGGVGITVYSRGGRKGKTTGGVRRCQLEGCTGRQVRVRWPDNSVNYLCTKGLDFFRKGLKIQ